MDIVHIAAIVGKSLEEVGASYFLGGSVASSLQGDPRSTNDIDLVTDLRPVQVPAFAARLGPDFSIDEEALTEAIRRRASWNIFFLPQFIKIDLFAKGNTPFDESEFARRRNVEVRSGLTLSIKSPEDTVLRKLLWYRSGGEVSERQWHDVVEVLRVSGPQFDNIYLEQWAARLSLEALLSRARVDSLAKG